MVKIADLEKALRIDEDALNEALVEQPSAFYAVAKELSMTISLRDEAKQELEEIEAKVDMSIRSKAKLKEEKITEKQVESMKLQNDDVAKATDKLGSLTARVGQLTALKDAFVQRGYAIRSLCELHATNYFGSNLEGSANRMKNQQAEAVKAERARRGR